MKNPEVIMPDTRSSNPFIVQNVALEAAGMALSLVGRVPPPFKSLADQVVRSASSVPANIAEGNGRSGRDRMHHWRIAYGSGRGIAIDLPRCQVRSSAVSRRSVGIPRSWGGSAQPKAGGDLSTR